MNKLKIIYNLKDDKNRIKMVQEASLDKSLKSGLKVENGILFGTQEWFNAIKIGLIPKHTVKGIISRVFISGHDDFPEFEICSEGSKSIWVSHGIIPFSCQVIFHQGTIFLLSIIMPTMLFSRPLKTRIDQNRLVLKN